jgi:hypothetical protein
MKKNIKEQGTTTEASHTPGPWFVNADNSLLVENKNRLRSIAEIHDHSDTANEELTEEAKANAHLIAAAPEMLEALKHMAAWLNSGVIVDGKRPNLMLSVVNQTIAKATGQGS